MSDPDAYLTDHAEALLEIGALSRLLSEVVHLDAVAGGLSDSGLRVELRRIADQARRRHSVQRRGDTDA